jgi:hypothetical protein
MDVAAPLVDGGNPFAGPRAARVIDYLPPITNASE